MLFCHLNGHDLAIWSSNQRAHRFELAVKRSIIFLTQQALKCAFYKAANSLVRARENCISNPKRQRDCVSDQSGEPRDVSPRILRTTAEHPFWVRSLKNQSGALTAAGDLAVGDGITEAHQRKKR